MLAAYPYGRHTIPAGAVVSVFDAATEAGLIGAKLALAASGVADTWNVPIDVPSMPTEVSALKVVSTSLTPAAQGVGAGALCRTSAGAVVISSADGQSWSSVSGDGGGRGTVVAIGDSIMHCSTFQGRKSCSFIEYAAIASNGALRIVGNTGVSGNTSAQLLARLNTDALAYASAEWVFVMIGTNDLINSVSLGAYRANLEAIASAILAAGKKPLFIGLAPHGTLNEQAYSAVMQDVAYRIGARYCDPWAPVRAGGGWVSGYSGDNVHPRAIAHRLAGQRLWQQVSPLFHGSHDLWAHDTDTSGYVVRQSNGLFLANTSGIPNGMTAWGSNPAALVNTTEAGTGEVQGNWWVQTYTAVNQICFFTSSNITLPSDWRAGDRVRLQCRIAASGLDANGITGDSTYSQSARLQHYIAWNWAGGAKTILRSVGSDIEGIQSLDDVIPANGPATGNWEIGVEYRNQTGSGTADGVVKIAQLNMHNLTRPGRA